MLYFSKKYCAGMSRARPLEDVVLAALKQTLIIDRAYRAGLAFVMNQIPETEAA